MREAFKKMIFFAEIFLKKYQTEFKPELEQRRSLSIKIQTPRESTVKIDSEPDLENHEIVIEKKPDSYYDQEYFWSEEYLQVAEVNFECVFNDLFEDKFVNAIFEKNEALIE